MAANGTPQAMLRRLQGGSPTSQGQNERAQRATRNTSPNTVYNQQGSSNMYGMINPFSSYNPYGMYPAMGQYGNQQSNLERYRPPTGSGGDRGGYAYNIPNAYGSTGLNYMSGFGDMGIPFNPFIGYQNPQMNFGNAGQDSYRQQGNGEFMTFLRQMFGGRQQGQPNVSGLQTGLQNRAPVDRGNEGYRPYKGGGFGPMPLNQPMNRKPLGMSTTPGQEDIANVPSTSTPYYVPGSMFGYGSPWQGGG